MFKNNLKEIRIIKNMTLSELSEAVGITPGALSMFENGKRTPKAETLKKISMALDAEIEDLFNDDLKIALEKENDKNRRIALKRADGVCELCGQNAPFITDEGEPYLVTKEIEKNFFVAVCPNCKAKLSILSCKGEKKYLKNKINLQSE